MRVLQNLKDVNLNNDHFISHNYRYRVTFSSVHLSAMYGMVHLLLAGGRSYSKNNFETSTSSLFERKGHDWALVLQVTEEGSGILLCSMSQMV